MTLGNFLREKRLEKNVSQITMSQLIGVSFATYNKLEQNKIRPSYLVIGKIANYFKLDVNEIRRML